jgi:hypothetical protein
MFRRRALVFFYQAAARTSFITSKVIGSDITGISTITLAQPTRTSFGVLTDRLDCDQPAKPLARDVYEPEPGHRRTNQQHYPLYHFQNDRGLAARK